MITTHDHEVNVPLSKKHLKMRIAGLIVIGLGAAAFAPLFEVVVPRAATIGFFFGLIFLAGAGLAAWKLYAAKPGLILSPGGLRIQTMNMPQELCWNEVTALSTTDKDGGGIVIHIRDAGRFLHHGNVLWQRAYEAQQLRYGSPIVILTKRLNISAGELMEHIRDRIERHKARTADPVEQGRTQM